MTSIPLPPPHDALDFDFLTCLGLGPGSASMRDNTLTIANPCYPSCPSLASGGYHRPTTTPSSEPERYFRGPQRSPSPSSEYSLASSPLSIASSVPDASSARTGPNDDQAIFPSTFCFKPLPKEEPNKPNDVLTNSLYETSLTPATSSPSLRQPTIVPPLLSKHDDSTGEQQKFQTACANVRGMASSGLPLDSIQQYLLACQPGLRRDVPAHILLQGLIEYEHSSNHHYHNHVSSPSSHSLRSASSTASSGYSAAPHSASNTTQTEDLEAYAVPAGPRMYQCPECPLVFNRAFNFREHRKTHDPTSIRPFGCPLCIHASHRRADMHRHIKNVHLKKEQLTSDHRAQIVAAYPSLRGEVAITRKRAINVAPP